MQAVLGATLRGENSENGTQFHLPLTRPDWFKFLVEEAVRLAHTITQPSMLSVSLIHASLVPQAGLLQLKQELLFGSARMTVIPIRVGEAEH